MWVRTESDAARSSTGGNLEAASGDVSRVRVALEGSRAFAAGAGSDTHPDAGDWVAPRCRRCGDRDGRGGRGRASVRGPGSGPHSGRHCAGASDSLGRGLRGMGRVGLGPSRSRCLGPGRVAFDRAGVGCGIGRRGSAVGGGLARKAWAVDGASEAEARLQAELGYGLRPPVGRGVLTPLCGPLGSGRRRRAHIPHRRAMERRARVRAGARGQPRRRRTRRKRRHHRNPQRLISLEAVACAMQSNGPRAPSGQGFHSNLGSRVDVDSHRSDSLATSRHSSFWR